MNTCILTIGNELLQGFTIDTNSSWLGAKLSQYNVEIIKTISIGDDLESIINEAQKIINEEYSYLFVTGGLGPTHDDITKQAFSKLLNSKLIFDEEYYFKLKKYYKKKSIIMPEINRSQAMIIENSDIIPNINGSALGIHYLYNKTDIFIMPGVPSEMKSMMLNNILPNYFEINPIKKYATIKTVGIIESKLSEKVTKLINEYSDNYNFAFLPNYSGVSFRISNIKNQSNLQFNKIINKFYKSMHPYSYGIGDITLQDLIAQKLIENKITIATAESCTGGLIGKYLTDAAGSSCYYFGSIVAYNNEMKLQFLDVSLKTLQEYGSVSEQVALEMAIGIRKRTNSEIGLSTTGISGPGGATKNKPKGLVYIAISTSKNNIVKKYIFNSGRSKHRKMTAIKALDMIRLYSEKIFI